MLKVCPFLLLLACTPLSAQLLNWGVKGGVPLNDAVKAAGTYTTEFHRWTLGPMVELDLPAGLGIEANMLYRRVGYGKAASAPDGTSTGIFNSNSWTFPILLKYKFPGTLARMYVSGGFAFRALSDVPDLLESKSKGLVLGGGIRYDVGVLKISPELRFTRWNNDVFDTNDGRGSTLNSRKSQVEFLVGINF